MCYNILIMCSNFQINSDYYDKLVPLYIKIISKKFILDITPTVLGLLTWDLVCNGLLPFI